jgi:hypothetical protein
MPHTFTCPQSPLIIVIELRLELIVVSSPFGRDPFVDGILGHNLLLSHAFSVGNSSWMGF